MRGWLIGTIGLLMLFWAVTSPTAALEFSGTVVEVSGDGARIELEGDVAPQPGDRVTIEGRIEGLPMPVTVEGDWRVARVANGTIWAENRGAPGTPEVGFSARIVPGGPAEPTGTASREEPEPAAPVQPVSAGCDFPPCGGALSDAPAVSCDPEGVCRESGTGLPLRLLPRPLSHIYAKPDRAGGMVRENVPAFFPPLYVFARRDLDFSDHSAPRGWYQVGYTIDAPDGWMQAKDAMEWRQALVVSYTHHGKGENERQRVLMFDSLNQLRSLVEAEDTELQALSLYRKLKAGEVPQGVVSKEPEAFIDITETFYVLPVLQYDATRVEGDDVRYLRVAAAVPEARGADTLADEETRRELMTPPEWSEDRREILAVDVVFVMDMTTSMQPYMDATKDAVDRLAKRIAEQSETLGEKIRFGLIGYRDDTRLMPALEFTAQNFTPLLVDGTQFSEILESEARAAIVSSKGYSEDMFAGVAMALQDVAWTPGNLRFVIIVGDASAHPAGHEQNSTGMDAPALRRQAEDQQIHRMAWHLRDPRYPQDHPVAETQLKTLTEVRSPDRVRSAVVAVDLSRPDAFAPHVEEVAQRIAERLAATKTQSAVEPAARPVTSPGAEPSRQAFDSIFDAALVEYLGREAEPPKDIMAWVLDRDLTDTTVPTLDVRVMITRRQLNDLLVALDTVMKAVARAEASQQQFFDALQAVAAQTAKAPERIPSARALKDAGLLPAFIESLPYQSDILTLSEERFGAMIADERYKLIQSLRAKMEQYRRINESDHWISLNEGDPAISHVYPLSLDSLP